MLTDQYCSGDFFRNPRPFLILGPVVKGGSYPYISGLTVAQAVAIPADRRTQGGARHRRCNGLSGRRLFMSRSDFLKQGERLAACRPPYSRVHNRIRRECA
jgi:hypothetical protein